METIAIIDRHPIIRAGLEVFIRSKISNVSITGFDSFYHFNNFDFNSRPDLFIVGNTVELPKSQCKHIMGIKEKNSHVKVILFDDNPDSIKVSMYSKSGVTGFIGRYSDMSELLKCISEVQNGNKYICNEIMDILLPKWISPGLVSVDTDPIALTNRELEVANFLINGHTVSEISRKFQRKVSTISTIKKNLFDKLNITNLVDLRDSLTKVIRK